VGGITLAVGISKVHGEELAVHIAEPSRAVEDLQAHIARELHDQVAQPLIALVLDVAEVRMRVEAGGDLKPDLARIEDQARDVLRQTREMLIDMRGHADLRVSFVHVLRNELPITPGHQASLQVSSRWPRRINGWAAFNLLRIVQQAVANALRHGRAEKIDIFLDISEAAEAVLVVLDDGIGLDGTQRGYGMVGMEERAQILGGSFSAQPRETGGTRIEVRVPCNRIN
jgi:signal transduction histidine kinase